MMENNQTSNSQEELKKESQETPAMQPEKTPKIIKRKLEITQKGLIALQYISWFLGIVTLICIILIAMLPEKTANLLFQKEIFEQSFDINFFYFVIPYFCIFLTIIALLFYGISRLIRTMIRYRNEINQLKDMQL